MINTTTTEERDMLKDLASEFTSAASLNNSRAFRWLSDRIAQGRKGVYAEIAHMTPEIAQLLLDSNADNRRLNPGKVREYTEKMRAGIFELNGQSIIVSRDGFLNDGQHRCAACINSGAAIDTVMVFGVQRDSRYTVDAGMKREAGQLLSMRGVKNAHANATMAKLLQVWESEKIITRSKRNIGNDDVYRFFISPSP